MYLGFQCPLFFPTANGIIRKNVLLKDISTGGIGFIMPEREKPIPLNKRVRIQLTDGSYKLDLHAEIIRIVNLEEQHSILYGCRFLTLNPEIGRYIMKKQGTHLKQRRS